MNNYLMKRDCMITLKVSTWVGSPFEGEYESIITNYPAMFDEGDVYVKCSVRDAIDLTGVSMYERSDGYTVASVQANNQEQRNVRGEEASPHLAIATATQRTGFVQPGVTLANATEEQLMAMLESKRAESNTNTVEIDGIEYTTNKTDSFSRDIRIWRNGLNDYTFVTDFLVFEGRNLGMFKVRMREGNINIENMSYYIEGEDEEVVNHPHVRDGSACFGNIDSNIFSAIAERDYFTAATLITEFLSSFNKDDEWGKTYLAFPLEEV